MNLIFGFILSSIMLLVQTVIFPGVSFLPFAPWIALVILKASKSSELPRTLWLTSLAGVFTDLFSDHPIGLYAIVYCLSSLFLFRIRTHFLHEKILHLSIFTMLISFVSTQLQLFFLFLFDRRVPITGKWAISDWFGMPLVDGLFACIWFAGPLFLLSKANRIWVLFWLKKKFSPN